MPFVCSICEEQSTTLCVNCTKDTCANHLCPKCGCCSDCCTCEVRLDESMEEMQALGPHEPEPQPHPMPDPDPSPEPEPVPTYPRVDEAV